jgi:hypothetical protein
MGVSRCRNKNVRDNMGSMGSVVVGNIITYASSHTAEVIAILLLMALGGFFDSVIDKLKHHYNNSVFFRRPDIFNPQYWKPTQSWVNKYKRDIEGKVIKDSSGKYIPAFFLSTTALVFLTDGWHLAQFLRNAAFKVAVCVALPFSLPYAILAYVILTIILSGSEHVTFHNILD